MLNMQTVPIKCFVVRNIDTCHETEFQSFDAADSFLNIMRERQPGINWIMYAEIDA